MINIYIATHMKLSIIPSARKLHIETSNTIALQLPGLSSHPKARSLNKLPSPSLSLQRNGQGHTTCLQGCRPPTALHFELGIWGQAEAEGPAHHAKAQANQHRRQGFRPFSPDRPWTSFSGCRQPSVKPWLCRETGHGDGQAVPSGF